MLYELSSCEVIALRAACVEAHQRWSESAESAERCANNQRWSETTRAGAARMAKLSQERAAVFAAGRKALDEGRRITTLAQAKEALER
jgi:hypothetical protein